jgi:hypothetical protein
MALFLPGAAGLAAPATLSHRAQPSFRHVAVDHHLFLTSASVDTDYVCGFVFGFRELGPRLISAIFEYVILAGSSLSS